VTFADDGPGIPPENAGRIFDPFFTTKRPTGGSGLGLTICLAVTKEHGGTIEVESTSGGGATLHVLFPVSDSPREAGESSPLSISSLTPAPRSARPPVGAEVLRGCSVLIVDDEESIREIVEDGLASRGMKVTAVATSEAALSHLAANGCDVVLCDYNLPGMNGDQFFERLRIQHGSLSPRFVFMTGGMLEPAVTERYRARGAAVLQKPFRVSALVSLLTDLLQPQPSAMR
jgi:two-component system, NtrC family, sensor kinase